MSDITDGLGSAAEGGLLARAVETDGAAGTDATKGEKTCLNCGAVLTGPHCHSCGQKGDVHRSLGAIGHEIMHGVLHLDGKIWRTLPLLAWKPGELTRRYIDGERAKFVSPMAMFLFSVFLMFAVFQAMGFSTPSNVQPSQETVDNIEQAGQTARQEAAQKRADLEAQLSGLSEGDPRRSQLEIELEEVRSAEILLDGAEAAALTLEGDSSDGYLNIEDTGLAFLDNGLVKKWRENPGLMLYKMQTNAYKFSWLLIPISLPFVWLLFFWKRRFKTYDHAIFVTYSIAFMSLLFIVLSLLTAAGIGGGLGFLALAIIPPFHIYRQLRGTYSLSRFGALVRTAILIFMILSAISFIFAALLLLLGAV